MSTQEKTFQVNCPNPDCNRPFHLRLPLADPKAQGSGDIRVDCMYCNKNVMVTISRKYIGKEFIFREDG
jgi:hypothetical protein